MTSHQVDHTIMALAPTGLGPVTFQTCRDTHSIGANTDSSSISSSSLAPHRTLQELSIGQAQNANRGLLPSHHKHQVEHSQFSIAVDLEDANAAKGKPLSRGFRGRSSIDSNTFEPLDAVQEEASVIGTGVAGSPRQADPQLLPQVETIEAHPLLAAEPPASDHLQFQKHLQGQFEWLLSCPAPATPVKDSSFPHDAGKRHDIEFKVYGCNLLSRQPKSTSHPTTENFPADTYTLLATPLEANDYSLADPSIKQALSDSVTMALAPPPTYELHQISPLKAPEVVEIVEHPVSPSLTLISERSSSYAGSSRAGSFSVPRIEDSLEELDKLEEELEAINAVTQSRRMLQTEGTRPSHGVSPISDDIKKSAVTNRPSMAGLSATVRIKSSTRAQPSLRRSTSLIFREKQQDECLDAPKTKSKLPRSKLPSSQSASLRTPIKSTKPLTVPKFELPGESVSRRLKEQREARRAQQAEAQKAFEPPPKPKPSRLLTKPNFELPGEAISRRKREEREVRLRAQEEEERKKREFKARPVRVSITPSAFPRETATSRARQGKTFRGDDERGAQQTAQTKRASLGVGRLVPSTDGGQLQPRGRLSTATSQEDLGRGTSTSGGSASGKRSTLTVEEIQQFRIRGREIFQRDNTRFTQDREREKKEREATARSARAQAAERSRTASREWAEKKRLKEQSMRESMRAAEPETR